MKTEKESFVYTKRDNIHAYTNKKGQQRNCNQNLVANDI